MVIIFKGTDKSKNYAPQALALCAGLSATKYLKKTLIIQLTTKYPVEKYLIGRKIDDQSIDIGLNLFEDSGMDSLTRRAGVTTFNADHFANAVKPVVSSENLFDILEVSRKVESDVEREIIQDPTVIGAIIKSAKRIYDNIFILANGKSVQVIDAVLPYVDKTVTCVRQGIKEEVSAPSTDANFYLVTDYDYKSTYSPKQMMRIYGVKKIFIMPYNVEFKDYYTDKNMLQFILHNTEPEKSDYSYHIINEMSKLVHALIEDEELIEDAYKFTYRTFERIVNEPISLTGDNAYIEREKRFLRKEKKLAHVSMDEEFASTQLDDEFEEVDPEYVPDKKALARKKKEDKARAKREAAEKKAKLKAAKRNKKKATPDDEELRKEA